MKKGTDLLKSTKLDKSDIEEIEVKYNVDFPNLYRLFILNFYVGENSIFYEMFYHPVYKDERYLSYFTYALKPEIEFSGFNSVENSILFSIDVEDKKNIKYLMIGHCNIGGILLGLKGDERDKVFYYNPDVYPNTYIEIANNIFDFIQGIEQVLEDLEGISYSKLYKNWNEVFWRVKVEDLA